MTSAASLVARLWAKIEVKGPDECWPWRAGTSLSGRRKVRYGLLREGGSKGRRWRAHRLVLLFKTAEAEVPRDDGEPFEDWLKRANRVYEEFEASHTCDNSMCCNPRHLAWELHIDNVKNQRRRRADERAAKELYDAAV